MRPRKVDPVAFDSRASISLRQSAQASVVLPDTSANPRRIRQLHRLLGCDHFLPGSLPLFILRYS